MKKIPTLFKRDETRRYVIDEVTPGCEWVLAGEGFATFKWDGTCCLVRDGRLYKRREVKADAPIPDDFEEVDYDDVTGKRVGWVPVGDGPDDKYHREAIVGLTLPNGYVSMSDGTYELVGPKINGNRHGLLTLCMARHGAAVIDPPRTFDALRVWMPKDSTFEGIVWHHPDGRAAKLKVRDFPR